MTINFKLFNQIVQLLAFDKMNQFDINIGEVTPFASSQDVESKTGFYKMILGRYFFGLDSDIEVDKLIESGIIVKTKEVYWIDEEEDPEEVVKLDVEVEDGETIYAYNGYEVYPEENEKIYKYIISQDIIEKAHEIYEECKVFIDNETNTFTFVEGLVKYEVPLYAIVLLNAFNKRGDFERDMLNLSFSDEEFKDIIEKIEDVSILIHASTKAESIKTIDWKKTIFLNSWIK